MSTWTEIESAAPALSAAVRARFDASLHKTMATLRADGSPRISGTEVVFGDGGVWIGSMPNATKAHDLRRDGRCAIHSAPIDETLTDGDAKLAGVAREIVDMDQIHRVWPEWDVLPGASESHAFRIDVHELVLVTVEGESLVITDWHRETGLRVRRR